MVIIVLVFHIRRTPTTSRWQSCWQGFSVLTVPNQSVLSTKDTLAFILCFKFIFILLKSTRDADRRRGDSADLSWGNGFLPKLLLICSYGDIQFAISWKFVSLPLLVILYVSPFPGVKEYHVWHAAYLRAWRLATGSYAWHSLPTKDTGTMLQSHTFSSNLENNCTRNFKNHTWLRLVQFLKLPVQLFPKSDSNVCDHLY